jgi:hypothetical protein
MFRNGTFDPEGRNIKGNGQAQSPTQLGAKGGALHMEPNSRAFLEQLL